jgi:hypothetical protein
MTSVMSSIVRRHHGDKVNQSLQFVMIETTFIGYYSSKIVLLDEFLIEIFEFLKTVLIFEKLFDSAIFVAQEFFDRGTTLTPV